MKLPGGRGRLYCFPITFLDPLRLPVCRHIATGESFVSLEQIQRGTPLKQEQQRSRRDKTLG